MNEARWLIIAWAVLSMSCQNSASQLTISESVNHEPDKTDELETDSGIEEDRHEVVLNSEGFYQNVIVEIADDVEENPRLVENVKNMFKEAQNVLQKATQTEKDKGLRFGAITITVPRWWKGDYNSLKTKLVAPPSVRVEPPHPHHGHVPYTFQPGGCGEGGFHIHLTPQYVLNMFTDEAQSRIGRPGVVLVHEWAHLRWGVFNEYVNEHPPDSSSKLFYLNAHTKQIKASTCPANIAGWIVEPSSAATHENGEGSPADSSPVASLQKCTSTDEFGMPSRNCFFVPNPNQTTNGSIMSYVGLNMTPFFCGKLNTITHNVEAPTPQNERCGGRSVWEVMMEHQDFSRNRTEIKRHQINDDNNSTKNVAPTITVYKRTAKKIFLILKCTKEVQRNDFSSIFNSAVRFRNYLLPPTMEMKILGNGLREYNIEDGCTDQLNINFTKWDYMRELNKLEKNDIGSTPALVIIYFPRDRVLEGTENPSPEDEGANSVPPGGNRAMKSSKDEAEFFFDEILINADCMNSTAAHDCKRCHSFRPRPPNHPALYELLHRILKSQQQNHFGTQQLVNASVEAMATPEQKGNFSGGFFLNPCEGDSTVLLVLANKKRHRVMVPVLTLRHEGSEVSPMVTWDNETNSLEVIIPCNESLGNWTYSLQVTGNDTTLVNVRVLQVEDKSRAIRLKTYLIEKTFLGNSINSTTTSNGTSPTTQEKNIRGTVGDIITVKPSKKKRSANNEQEAPPARTCSLSSSKSTTTATGQDNSSSNIAATEGRSSYSATNAARMLDNHSRVRLVAAVIAGPSGQDPVLGAVVTAVITMHDSSSDTRRIPLVDTGVGGDQAAGDGFYTAFLSSLPQKGRYSLSVEAMSGPNTFRLVSSTSSATFWQEKASSDWPGNKFTVKVHCSSAYQNPSLLLHLNSSGSVTTLELHREDAKDNPQGNTFVSRPAILKSARLNLLKNCDIISIDQAEGHRSVDRGPLLRGSGTTRSSAVLSSAADLTDELGDPSPHCLTLGTGPMPREQHSPLQFEADVRPFSRKESVAEFVVVSSDLRDYTPPGKITDLTVSDINYRDQAITLSFTSTGDDNFEGTAESLDLRYSKSHRELVTRFSGTEKVEENKHVGAGKLQPKKSYERHEIYVLLEDMGLKSPENDVLYFAIKARDESNNVADVSNVAVAHFSLVEKTKAIAVEETNQQRRYITMAVITVLCLVLILVVCAVRIKYIKSKEGKHDLNDSTSGVTFSSRPNRSAPNQYGTHERSRPAQTEIAQYGRKQ